MLRELRLAFEGSYVWLSQNASGKFSVVSCQTSLGDKVDSEVVKLVAVANGHRDAFAEINRLLLRAKNFAESQAGSPVYIEMKFDEASWWRARVLDGRCTYTGSDMVHSWRSSTPAVSLSIERTPWEGPETELPLTNNSGSGTGGRAVGNETSGATENWVTVAGANVSGDLPALTRLELTHTYATNPFIKEIWLHHKVDSPTSFAHFIQGESASGGSNTADATASGGSKKSLSWSGTAKTKLLEWTLPAASLNAMAGGYAHLLMRHDGAAYGDLYFQFQLRNPTGYTLIHDGSLTPFPNGNEMEILDNFRLPPGGLVSGSSNLILELYAQRLTSATHSLAIDFVQLSAIGPGNSWHKLVATGTGLRDRKSVV